MNGESYKFSVKFDGQEHTINTETYIQALLSLTAIIKEVNYHEGQTERITIDIEAQKQGSFDVSLLIKTAEHLFSTNTVVYLSSVMSIVTGLVAIKKVHKKADSSKTVMDGDDVTIKDNNGTVILQTNRNTYNIFQTNQVVQDALSDNFKSLEKDETITGYEIKHGNEIIRADREEFNDLAERVEVQPEDKEVSEVSANLIIVKLVFEGEDRKWDFLYNGNKISATVTDKAFWENINSGEKFAKGDELVCDLRIIREFDPNISAFMNRDYQVISVREHHPREFREQISIEGLSE